MLKQTKYPIKSNRYKITNKIKVLYLIDFIGYFILFRRLAGKVKPHPHLPLELRELCLWGLRLRGNT